MVKFIRKRCPRIRVKLLSNRITARKCLSQCATKTLREDLITTLGDYVQDAKSGTACAGLGRCARWETPALGDWPPPHIPDGGESADQPRPVTRCAARMLAAYRLAEDTALRNLRVPEHPADRALLGHIVQVDADVLSWDTRRSVVVTPATSQWQTVYCVVCDILDATESEDGNRPIPGPTIGSTLQLRRPFEVVRLLSVLEALRPPKLPSAADDVTNPDNTVTDDMVYEIALCTDLSLVWDHERADLATVTALNTKLCCNDVCTCGGRRPRRPRAPRAPRGPPGDAADDAPGNAAGEDAEIHAGNRDDGDGYLPLAFDAIPAVDDANFEALEAAAVDIVAAHALEPDQEQDEQDEQEEQKEQHTHCDNF